MDFAFKASLVVIDLAGNRLQLLPPQCFSQCVSLSSLDLSDNQLADIPESVWGCSRLTWLNVFSNNIRELSSKIGLLTELRELFVGNNIFTALPRELTRLRLLKILHCAGNAIETLDPALLLESLEKLYCSRNLLSEFPNSALGSCPKLETIDLAGNNIVHAVVTGVFASLQELVLSHNKMDDFSFPSASLQKLVVLDLSDNGITNVPDVGNLSNLEILNLLHCNISQMRRKQLDKHEKLSIIYMQGNPVEKQRDLRLSFVERKTDLLITDLYKVKYVFILCVFFCLTSLFRKGANNTLQFIPRLRNSSNEPSVTAENSSVFFSWSEIKGARTTQEDAMSLRHDMGLESRGEIMQLYAVFDGHRGADVAQLCAVQFPIALRQGLIAGADQIDPMKVQCLWVGGGGKDSIFDLLKKKAMIFAFDDINARIKASKLTDGATAAVALVLQNTITLAHVGDARAVLFCLDPDEGAAALAEAASGQDFAQLTIASDECSSVSSVSSSSSTVGHVSTKSVRMRNGRRGFMVSTVDHTAKNRVERRRVDDLGGYCGLFWLNSLLMRLYEKQICV